MIPALTTPTRTLTLEDERDALQHQDATLTEGRKAFALALHRLRIRWGYLYPRSSTREFIAWFGDGEVAGRHYAYLRAGLAAEAGLDRPGLLFGELAAFGERLEHGELPADIAAGAPPKLPEKTSIRVTRETADALDATFAELSESETRLTRQDALETVVQAFASAPPAIRAALVHANATGENPLDALIKAVDERKDYRAALKRQGCVICGVTSGIELHHAKTEAGDRFRTHNRLIPLCQRHHGARPGDDADSIHARSFADLKDDAEFWRRAFIAVSDAAEQTRSEDSP